MVFKRMSIPVLTATSVSMILWLCCTLAADGGSCYMPGERLDPKTFFLDAQQKPLKLLDAIGPGTRVAVLVIFGGAYLTTTDKHGGIWCEDSLDEFANLKAAANRWKEEGVRFLAVACPPVYSDKYGFEKEVFLTEPQTSPKYREAVDRFIARTEALKKERTIPFDPVYYDPRFRLLWNSKEHPGTEAYGKIFPWQGRLKWHKDDQRYGTPCIWFLDAGGKVLREPLYGNNYSAVPPKILYTYWELEGAIAEALAAVK